MASQCLFMMLYIFCFLHQTTTCNVYISYSSALYIFCFLHQTTTEADTAFSNASCISFVFYIKPQLCAVTMISILCCISFVFYIKPQLTFQFFQYLTVVYLLFSTSNHNFWIYRYFQLLLYIFCFLHQTTTVMCIFHILPQLYIFCFLHQTTTKSKSNALCRSCISFVFYIKPQHLYLVIGLLKVVYLLFSTSNHNYNGTRRM